MFHQRVASSIVHLGFTAPRSVVKPCSCEAVHPQHQVPESVAFAFLAHVKPHVALHAAWVIGFLAVGISRCQEVLNNLNLEKVV